MFARVIYYTPFNVGGSSLFLRAGEIYPIVEYLYSSVQMRVTIQVDENTRCNLFNRGDFNEFDIV